MNTSLFTNIMLSVIAVLLLVLVVQNGMKAPGYSGKPGYSKRSGYSSQQAHGSTNPSVKANAAPMAGGMFFQALSGFPEGCESANTLAECNSAAAEAVKKEVMEVAAGAGPRKVFDYVVNKYGIEALTPQAQKIRAMRTSQ